MKKLFALGAMTVLTVAAMGCSKAQTPTPALPDQNASAQPKTEAQKQAEKQLDDAIKIAFQTVYFEFDSFVLTTGAQENLRTLAKAIKANPGIKIQVEGHADERGSNEYNLALGDKRAQSIKEFLVGEGVAEAQLVTKSAGEEKPEAQGTGEEVWAKNRRGIFTRLN